MSATIERACSPSSGRNLFGDMVPSANQTPGDHGHQTLPQAFAAVVGQHGSRPALSSPELKPAINYLTLETSAIHLALMLEFDPAAPPEICAVFLPTDAAHIIAVLGVLKAGQVWMSLDPSYPDERVALMVAETLPRVIITQPDLATRARSLCPHARVVCWTPVFSAQNADDCAPVADPWRPAGVFHTSGSTGRPKSAVHTHASILFDIQRQTRDLQITCEDRFDLLFSASFSAFLAPVFGALLTGASVHLWPPRLRSFTELRDWLEDQRITVSTMSVSSYRRLVAVPPRRGFPDLRVLSIGAEPLSRSDYELFSARFPASCRLQNALATTETRTIAHECHPATANPPNIVTCGFPVAGKRIEIRDTRDQALPPGSEGEIVIVSDAISPGTWAFVRDLPQRTLGGPRLTVHRTGDLGRFLPDGRLIHLGRLDYQLKIRGHRVEALEVEHALLGHATIADAAVCVVPTDSGMQMLTAFLMASPGGNPAPETLRKFLLDRLPDYAVPARFVVVKSLPLTPTGKLDRRALPSLLERLVASGDREPANGSTDCSPLLQTVLRVWSQALGTSLNPDDDFFAHGGDSLQAVETMSLLQATVPHQLSPGLIVEHPTAQRLAHHLARLSRKENEPVALRTLRPGKTDLEPVIFVPPWNHSCTLLRDLAREAESRGNHPWFALESIGSNEHPPTSFEALASLYVAVLESRHPATPFCLAGYSAGGFIVWEIARQLEAAGRRDVRVILMDCPKVHSRLTPEEEIEAQRSKRPITKTLNLIAHAVHPRGLHRSDFVRELLFGKLSWWLYRQHRKRAVDPYAEAYEHNIQLSIAYTVAPLALPVAIIRARHQAGWIARFQADLGWRPFCNGPFTVREVNSGHIQMLYAPHARTTSRLIDELSSDW